jgi:uncharacterized protein (DUF2147 family)
MVLSVSYAFAAPSDEILGVWMTEGESATVEIVKEGDTYMGRIIALKEPLTKEGQPKKDVNNPEVGKQNNPIIGLAMVWGFKFDEKKGAWVNGNIYDPEEGKSYYCKATIEDGKLMVRGSLGKLGLAGRTDIWTRKPAEAKPADAKIK